ncbi:NADH dehydrogenase [ubiquinone] 1 beta subcomplex subunit 2, mitochondrial-like [Lycorma delicatula]|uniref:NADH dehydrogenase [ubiquinone] 1 beta subcomplex subunit 2, mitochondrial-like n=1 Tax=Lycorma delicatula TaxID=130591 RepID=UPI003F51A80A
MSVSRGFHLFRRIGSTLNSKPCNYQQVRNSSEGWVYRTSGHEYNNKWLAVAEFNMAMAWWWFLWHCFHEYEFVIGEFDVPDPRDWTNEELGIPPDSEG